MSSIVRHRWINRGYATLPVDYLEFQSIPISLHTLPAHPIMQDEDEDDSELLASSRLGSPLARHHPFWDVWMIENGLLYPPLQSRKVEGGGGGGGINTSNTRISIPVSPKPLISLELSHTLLALDTVDSGQHLITLLKNQNLKSSGSSSSSTDQLLLFENSFNQFLLEREYNMKRMTNLVEIHDHGKISAVGTHTGLTKNASWISSTRSTATTRSGVSDDNIELESVAGHSPPTSNDRYSSKHTQEIGSSSSSPSLVEYQRRKKRGCLALLTNIFISGKKTSKMNVENKSLSPSLSVFYDINKETGNTINNSNNNNSTFSTRRVYIARPSPIAWVRNYFAAFRGQTR